ncbi:MAG: GTPase [Butyrivibrio sp.]|nr:GTPase [Butyrivibrio sp.]
MSTLYFINGFLEAGKTRFIRDILKQEYFQIDGKTLIIACEEGNTEYDTNELSKVRADIEYIENEEDFTDEALKSLEKKYKPARIIIEYNGMWNKKNHEFIRYRRDVVEVVIFDATTFKLYSDNMRTQLAEHVRRADLALFYQSDKVRDQLAMFLRNLKAINQKLSFVFRGENEDIMLDMDETLPYDIEEDDLFLDDKDFAVFCIDVQERVERYIGKQVHFTARAYKLKDNNDFEFVAGRYIMTCCEADMTFLGILCSYMKAYELKNKEWVNVTGIIKITFDEAENRNIPVCRVTKLEKAVTPKNEIVNMI